MEHPSTATLESKVEEIFSDKSLDIKPYDKKKIFDGLKLIREYSEDSYSHHLRVSLKTRLLIENSQMDYQLMRNIRSPRDRYAFQRLGFFAGLLHDIGKTRFPKGFFDRDLTPEEREIQKPHVLYSYEKVLKMGYFLCAEMIVRHHLFEKDPYPKSNELPKFSIEQLRGEFEDQVNPTEIVLRGAARYLSLADHHDAWMYRRNSKNKNGGLTEDQIKDILKKEFSPLSNTIELIYSKEMFKGL